jgi:hypothetical protein
MGAGKFVTVTYGELEALGVRGAGVIHSGSEKKDGPETLGWAVDRQGEQ